MEWYEKVSLKVVRFVQTYLSDITEEDRDRIKYGVEAILVNLYSLPILFISAYLLGVIDLFMMVFFSFGLLRTFAGGFHARTSSSCLILTLITYASMIILASKLFLPVQLKFILQAIAYLSLLKYAPADNEEKPIVNSNHRRILNLFTCFFAFLYLTYSIIRPESLLGNVLFYVICFEALFVSPVFYIIFKRRWKNYEFIDDYFSEGN